MKPSIIISVLLILTLADLVVGMPQAGAQADKTASKKVDHGNYMPDAYSNPITENSPGWMTSGEDYVGILFPPKPKGMKLPKGWLLERKVNDDLYIVYPKDTLLGYCTKDGTVVITPSEDYIMYAGEGLFVRTYWVQTKPLELIGMFDKHIAYLDKSIVRLGGKFKNGIAPVQDFVGNTIGCIDHHGKFLTEPKYFAAACVDPIISEIGFEENLLVRELKYGNGILEETVQRMVEKQQDPPSAGDL